MVTVTVKNKQTAIQAKGSLLDVTIEAMMIVNNLYNVIARANPAEGERFREMVRHGENVWQLKRDAASFSGVLIVTRTANPCKRTRRRSQSPQGNRRFA